MLIFVTTLAAGGAVRDSIRARRGIEDNVTDDNLREPDAARQEIRRPVEQTSDGAELVVLHSQYTDRLSRRSDDFDATFGPRIVIAKLQGAPRGARSSRVLHNRRERPTVVKGCSRAKGSAGHDASTPAELRHSIRRETAMRRWDIDRYEQLLDAAWELDSWAADQDRRAWHHEGRSEGDASRGRAHAARQEAADLLTQYWTMPATINGS